MSREHDAVTLIPMYEEQQQAKKQTTHAGETTEELIDALRESMSGDEVGALVFSRHVSWTGALEHLESMPTDKLTPDQIPEYLRHNYGPGDYRIQVRMPGTRGFAANKLLTIGKSLADIEKEKDRGALPAPAAGDNSAMIAMMMRQMNDDAARREQTMLAALEKIANPQKPQWLEKMMTPEVMAIAVPAVTGLVTAIITRPKEKNDPIKQLLALLELKDKLAGDKDDAEPAGPWATAAQVAVGALAALQKPAAIPARPALPQPQAQPQAQPQPQPQPPAPEPTGEQADARDTLVNAIADDIERIAATAGAVTSDDIEAFQPRVNNDYTIVRDALTIVSDDAFAVVKKSCAELYPGMMPMLDIIEAERQNQEV